MWETTKQISQFFSTNNYMGKNKGQGKTYKLKKTKETHQPNMIHRPCFALNSNMLSIKSYKAIRKM